MKGWIASLEVEIVLTGNPLRGNWRDQQLGEVKVGVFRIEEQSPCGVGCWWLVGYSDAK